MVVLFSIACCGVTEDDKIWAGVDGETLEVEKALGEELIRCGYATLAVSKAPPKASKAKE